VGNLIAWFSQHPEARLLAGVVFFLLFGSLYFRRSQGTGKALFLLLATVLILAFWFSPPAHLLASLGLVAWLVWHLFRKPSRRPGYQPAVAIVEGGGVKRGLTAPEAAVLLEMPINTVLASVLIGLLKKSALQASGGTQTGVSNPRDSALFLDVAPDFRAPPAAPDAEGRAASRRAAAQKHNAILHPYEEPFLELFEAAPGRAVGELNFTAALRALVRHTARRVGGYDLQGTREYYRKHLGRARHDVARADSDPQGGRLMGHHLEWLVLDVEFAQLYRDYPPPWISGDKEQSSAAVRATVRSTPEGQGLAGWVERLEGELVGSVPAGGLQTAAAGGKRLALGGKDPVDAEFFKAIYDQVWQS
jgi:hypothetical protein